MNEFSWGSGNRLLGVSELDHPNPFPIPLTLPPTPHSKGSARGHAPPSPPCLLAPTPFLTPRKSPCWVQERTYRCQALPVITKHPPKVNVTAPTAQTDKLKGLTQAPG